MALWAFKKLEGCILSGQHDSRWINETLTLKYTFIHVFLKLEIKENRVFKDTFIAEWSFSAKKAGLFHAHFTERQRHNQNDALAVFLKIFTVVSCKHFLDNIVAMNY